MERQTYGSEIGLVRRKDDADLMNSCTTAKLHGNRREFLRKTWWNGVRCCVLRVRGCADPEQILNESQLGNQLHVPQLQF